jgi:hypothetical protein
MKGYAHMNKTFNLILSAVCLLAWGSVMLSYQEAEAQLVIQQSTLTWNAYVEPVPVAPATTIPASQQFSAYVVNRGIGSAVCMAAGVPLSTNLTTINKAVAPGITPTSFVDNTYPDQNGIVCWEIYVRFADGTFSLRSKRLIKEIISTKPSVANPSVQ